MEDPGVGCDAGSVDVVWEREGRGRPVHGGPTCWFSFGPRAVLSLAPSAGEPELPDPADAGHAAAVRVVAADERPVDAVAVGRVRVEAVAIAVDVRVIAAEAAHAAADELLRCRR